VDSNASQRCGGNSQGVNTNVLAGGLADLQHKHRPVMVLVRSRGGGGEGMKPG